MTRVLALTAAVLLAAGCATARPPAVAPPLLAPEPEANVARALRERVAAADRGEPLPGSLAAALRRFYEARGWRPAWTRALAADLLTAIRGAAAEGLRPGDYPLDRIDSVDGAELDLLLSGTFLRYGLHLSAGRFSPGSADTMWSAAPEEEGPDLAAALATAVDSARVGPILAGLAPPHAGYARLRAQLPQVWADGARQIEANLERWRWLPRDLGSQYVMVDIPAFTLTVVDGGRPVYRARVIVGRPDWPTPIVAAQVTHVVFNPAWYIPRAIALTEVIPAQARDSTFLDRNGIRVFPSTGGTPLDPTTVDWGRVTERSYAYRLVQDPGPANPLGAVRLHAANPFGVTLHDTPQRELFSQSVRSFSHGCVRVARALDLASLLLQDVPGWSPDTVAAVLLRGRERAAALPRPVPVVLAYWTAWVDEDGVLQLRDDVYGWDARLASVLASPPAALSRSSSRTSASSVCEKS